MKFPSEIVIQGILIEAMSKEQCKFYDITSWIESLRLNKKIQQPQAEELMRFFLLDFKDYFTGKQEDQITNNDFEFFIRKLFELKNIPKAEQIKLIYNGLRFHKLNEEQSKELISDFSLIEFHNRCILEFEKKLLE